MPPTIRAVALCVIRRPRDGAILVTEYADHRERFARPIGGGIEFGETSAQAVAREVREELALEVEGVALLGVLENLFTFQGLQGHEVAFVYEARFLDPTAYDRESIALLEVGWSTPALWRRPDEFEAACRLVPEGLMALLNKAT